MCGLFGIISKEKVNVDKRAIACLGFVNDTRGGDACGLFIDGEIEYGTEGKNVNFFEFFRQSKLFKNATKANVVLGHCRKASVGGKSADKAQPIIIKSKDDPNKIDFVLLHNGTIKNYTDLAKKYIPDVDISGLSDTQIMALIFYKKGYDCLAEYNGGAVFVIADYRSGKPIVRMWKGCSKEYSYSKEETEERPLYVVGCNNKVIFSSIPEMLTCLYPENDVKTIKPNTLCRFLDGRLVTEREFDRSKCVQTVTSYSSAYTDDRDLYSSNYYGSRYQGGGGTIYSSRKAEENKAQKKETTSVAPYSLFNRTQPTLLDLTKYRNSVYCDNNTLKYYVNKVGTSENIMYFDPARASLLHGVYNINKLGFIRQNGETDCELFAFFNGTLLSSVSCYRFIERVAKLWNVEFDNMENLAPYLVNSLSMYPHCKEVNGIANIFFVSNPDKDFDDEIANGDYDIIFTTKHTHFENGVIARSSVDFASTYKATVEQMNKYVIDNRNILSFLDTSYD